MRPLGHPAWAQAERRAGVECSALLLPLSPFPRPVFLPRGRNSGPTVDQSGCVGSSKKVGRVPGASDQSALRRDLRDLSSLCAQDWARTFVPRRREKVTLVVDSLQQPTFVPM